MSDVREVLVKARELIADPERWVQHMNASTADRRMVASTSCDACKWCANGAVMKVAGTCWNENYLPAMRTLDQIGGGDIVHFNDTHTHAEVIAAFDRAIASTPSLSSPAKE